MKFLKVKEVLFIHSVIIDETGGVHGIRDMGLLESALAQPQQSFAGQDLYPSVVEKAAALITSLAKNHPFIDGNKRTSAVVMGLFLELNGSTLHATNDELVAFIYGLASQKPNDQKTVDWIDKNSTKIRK